LPKISDHRPTLSSSFPIPQKRRDQLPRWAQEQIYRLLHGEHFS
jgi:hypothetical protein